MVVEGRDARRRRCYRHDLHSHFGDGVDQWKLDRIYKFKPEETAEYPPHWRRITPNGIKPDQIRHCSLQDLNVSGYTVYVSTVHKDFWRHLEKDNDIIDAWTERDKTQLVKKKGNTIPV